MLRSGRAAPDEAVVRAEMTRQFDACDACRACVSYCAAFPLMFDLIHAVPDPAREAGDLTVADQDRIGDACTRCGLCVPACPYGHDVPGLFDRALAMRRATGQLNWRRRLRDAARARGERRTG